MTHGSLFSGIGGFDLAAKWVGWENVFHCEINQFCQKVLKYHFPNSIQHEDITKTDFTVYRGRIDVLTGGFPCQPFSLAGKRKGTADDRHLWPEMLRAIREISPTYIVGENVYGLVNWDGGVVFEQVQADLEAEGYEVQPVILPACAINAPHRRDRVWFVAKNTERCGFVQRKFEQERTEVWEQRNACTGNSDRVCLSTWVASDTSTERCDNRRYNWEKRYIQTDIRTSKKDKSERYGWKCGIGEIGKTITNYNNARLQRRKEQRIFKESREERNEQFARFFQPNWDNFPTQSPICGRNDGVSDRVDRLKSLGNAIVPQVVYEIFKAIQLTHKF